MPRKLRQFSIGHVYHIINRGVDGRKIFLNNQDYSRFILGLEFYNSNKDIKILDIIGRKIAIAVAGSDPAVAIGDPSITTMAERIEEQRENKDKPIVELMAFALMPNHYHFIIKEIVTGGISSYMQKIGGYSTYFNQQNDRSGSLFQSRYKCIEIKDDPQLTIAFNYVHTNPVDLIEPLWKSQQIKDFDKVKDFLENYKWSSYRDYIGIPTFLNSINKDFFLSFFDGEENCKKEVENWIKFKANNYVQKNQFNPKNFE